MSNKGTIIQAPKWLAEITTTPQKYVRDIFLSLAFAKMKEYERQIEIFERKYQLTFDKFEKKINSLKEEDFKMWDDYLEWKAIDSAYKKWLKRYQKF